MRRNCSHSPDDVLDLVIVRLAVGKAEMGAGQELGPLIHGQGDEEQEARRQASPRRMDRPHVGRAADGLRRRRPGGCGDGEPAARPASRRAMALRNMERMPEIGPAGQAGASDDVLHLPRVILSLASPWDPFRVSAHQDQVFRRHEQRPQAEQAQARFQARQQAAVFERVLQWPSGLARSASMRRRPRGDSRRGRCPRFGHGRPASWGM